jgi:hypothetical protein
MSACGTPWASPTSSSAHGVANLSECEICSDEEELSRIVLATAFRARCTEYSYVLGLDGHPRLDVRIPEEVFVHSLARSFGRSLMRTRHATFGWCYMRPRYDRPSWSNDMDSPIEPQSWLTLALPSAPRCCYCAYNLRQMIPIALMRDLFVRFASQI